MRACCGVLAVMPLMVGCGRVGFTSGGGDLDASLGAPDSGENLLDAAPCDPRDLLWHAGHETGDLSEYTDTFTWVEGAGQDAQLMVRAEAAHEGSFGVEHTLISTPAATPPGMRPAACASRCTGAACNPTRCASTTTT